jgi:hypothetical protein
MKRIRCIDIIKLTWDVFHVNNFSRESPNWCESPSYASNCRLYLSVCCLCYPGLVGTGEAEGSFLLRHAHSISDSLPHAVHGQSLVSRIKHRKEDRFCLVEQRRSSLFRFDSERQMDFVHVSPKVQRRIEALKLSGNTGAALAQKATRIIEKLASKILSHLVQPLSGIDQVG